MIETHWEITVVVESPNIDGTRYISRIHVDNCDNSIMLKDTMKIAGKHILHTTINHALKDYAEV